MTDESTAYIRVGNEFPPGSRVKLTGRHRDPTTEQVGYEQKIIDTDSTGAPIEEDDLTRPVFRVVEQSKHGMIATDAPPQQGVVVGHEPAVYPHVERRHRIELDFGQGFITTDFVELEALDG